jgi:hypothetical protein
MELCKVETVKAVCGLANKNSCRIQGGGTSGSTGFYVDQLVFMWINCFLMRINWFLNWINWFLNWINWFLNWINWFSPDLQVMHNVQ